MRREGFHLHSNRPLVFFCVCAFTVLAVGQDEIDVRYNAGGGKTLIEDSRDGGMRATTTDAKGNVIDIVTTEPSSKYGPGGTKTTVENRAAGQDTVVEIYKDAGGHVRSVSFHDNHPTSYEYNSYELDVEYAETGVATDWDEKKDGKTVNSLRTERPDGYAEDVKRFAKLGEEVRTPAEDIANKRIKNGGSHKPAEEDRLRFIVPTLGPKLRPGADPAFGIEEKEFPDIFTFRVTAPNKEVLEMYVPHNLFPGPCVGSMHVFHDGATNGDRPFGNAKLEIGDFTTPVQDGPFKCDVGSEPVGRLRVTDGKGKMLGGADLTVYELTDGPVPREFPTSATSGNLIALDFPAIAANIPWRDSTSWPVTIGEKLTPIIAANHYGLVTREDFDQPGLTKMRLTIGTDVYESLLRVLTLKLSAGSLNLLRGQTTNVHIVAGGLADLRAPAHMTIAVNGVVTMAGATAVDIDPKLVAGDGTYTTDRTLSAQSAGTFGVTVTVWVDKEPRDLMSPERVDWRALTEDDLKRHVEHITDRTNKMTDMFGGDGVKKLLEDAFKRAGATPSKEMIHRMAKEFQELWSDEAKGIYQDSHDRFARLLEKLHSGDKISRTEAQAINEAIDNWNKLDATLKKELESMADHYAKEGLIADQLRAVSEKYADKVEPLLKQQPVPRSEIDELSKQERAEQKALLDQLNDTDKQIDKGRNGIHLLDDLMSKPLNILPPNRPTF